MKAKSLYSPIFLDNKFTNTVFELVSFNAWRVLSLRLLAESGLILKVWLLILY